MRLRVLATLLNDANDIALEKALRDEEERANFHRIHSTDGDAVKLSRVRAMKQMKLIQPEDVTEAEWAAWYRLTPLERWRESEKLWAIYLALGGSLDPEPDTQSPFFDEDGWRANLADEWPGPRMVGRGGVQF